MKKIECEIYSRVCGFYWPVQSWNPGKKEEFRERTEYLLKRYETHKKTEGSTDS